MDESRIKRINELYHKSKAEGLTSAEKEEQAKLRAEYLAAIRANIRGQLNQIDIHGQRDTAYLLNTGRHIHLLDEYLKDDDLLNNVKNAYMTYDALRKEKHKAEQETYNENDAEFFMYQIKEIEDA